MFNYNDPTGGNFHGNTQAKANYQATLHHTYDQFAKIKASGFTWLEAMSELVGGVSPRSTAVDWLAFPLTATSTLRQIDSDRLRFQDEYVEWRVESVPEVVTRIVFTTEFPEYFTAFAQAGLPDLVTAIQAAIPGANPSEQELFGAGNVGNLSQTGRGNLFQSHLATNPWNNGKKGILCLTQQFNTLTAIFNLLGRCGIEQLAGSPNDTCSIVAPTGACGPERASDPRVCSTAQAAVRDGIGFTLKDPAGIRIVRLEGKWKLNGVEIDINDAAQNSRIWNIERNGLRGVLNVLPGLTIDDDVITTGAQISRVLRVAAALLIAPEDQLPDWARTGSEGLAGRNG